MKIRRDYLGIVSELKVSVDAVLERLKVIHMLPGRRSEEESSGL